VGQAVELCGDDPTRGNISYPYIGRLDYSIPGSMSRLTAILWNQVETSERPFPVLTTGYDGYLARALDRLAPLGDSPTTSPDYVMTVT